MIIDFPTCHSLWLLIHVMFFILSFSVTAATLVSAHIAGIARFQLLRTRAHKVTAGAFGSDYIKYVIAERRKKAPG